MKKSDIKISYPVTMNRKIPVISGIVIIFLVIIDLLMTRQILSYSNDTGLIMFFLTVIIGFGIGSWILLRYTGKISQEIRSKSHFINLMYWMVTITQFSLLGILLFVLFSNTMGILPPTVFAISSIAASIIMGIIAFKFFWWYKLSAKRNLTVLLYAIAAMLLAVSIAQEAFSSSSSRFLRIQTLR